MPQVGTHTFELGILGLQLFGALQLRGAHAAVLGLPVVVSRIGYPVLTANILDLHTRIALIKMAMIWVSGNVIFSSKPPKLI